MRGFKRGFKLDFVFQPAARLTYVGLREIHQADVDRRVDFLCEGWEPDDDVIFAWPEEGPGAYIYYDGA